MVHGSEIIGQKFNSDHLRKFGFIEIPVDKKKFPFERADIAFEMKF